MPTYTSPSLQAAAVSEVRTGASPVSTSASTDIVLTESSPFRRSAKSDLDESQLYYWTQQWQDAEKQARADIEAGRGIKLNGLDEIEAHFTDIAKEPLPSNEERDDILQ